MADRRSQSDESLIVEYFAVQPLAACDALLNQIADILRKRRPKKSEVVNNAKPTTEPTERKPSQKRKAGKEATTFTDETVERCAVDDCDRPLDDNVHQLQTTPYYHEFVERKGTAANA